MVQGHATAESMHADLVVREGENPAAYEEVGTLLRVPAFGHLMARLRTEAQQHRARDGRPAGAEFVRIRDGKNLHDLYIDVTDPDYEKFAEEAVALYPDMADQLPGEAGAKRYLHIHAKLKAKADKSAQSNTPAPRLTSAEIQQLTGAVEPGPPQPMRPNKPVKLLNLSGVLGSAAKRTAPAPAKKKKKNKAIKQSGLVRTAPAVVAPMVDSILSLEIPFIQAKPQRPYIQVSFIWQELGTITSNYHGAILPASDDGPLMLVFDLRSKRQLYTPPTSRVKAEYVEITCLDERNPGETHTGFYLPIPRIFALGKLQFLVFDGFKEPEESPPPPAAPAPFRTPDYPVPPPNFLQIPPPNFLDKGE